MQLRYFAALHDIAGERSSTVVFPLPIDLLGHMPGRAERSNVTCCRQQANRVMLPDGSTALIYRCSRTIGQKVRLHPPTRESHDGKWRRAWQTSPTEGIRAAKDSPKRAEAFKKMAETFGITVKELFWTQGRYDVVTVIEAPDEFSAMTLSLSLGALGNVRTESLRAFSAADTIKVVRQDALTAAQRFDHPFDRGGAPSCLYRMGSSSDTRHKSSLRTCWYPREDALVESARSGIGFGPIMHVREAQT